MSDIDKYYPNNSELRKAIKEIGDPNIPIDVIITNVIKAINILQNT